METEKFRDSNTPMLISIFKSHRFENIKSIGIISDDYDSIDEMFNKLSEDCDLVITTGGVSMGAKDLIKPYLAKNGEILFGRLNMKPGKPTTFGKLNSKLIFSLPGNPVSCFVSAQVLIIRALKIMSGYKDYEPSIINVEIPKPIKIDPIRPEYHRVLIYSESGKLNLQCISTGNQQSSRLLSTVTANGFLLLPSKLEYKKDKYDEETVQAILIGEIYHKR